MEKFLEQRLDGKGLEKLEKASLADVVKFTLGIRIKKAKQGMMDDDTHGYMILLEKYFSENLRSALEYSRTELMQEIRSVKEIAYQKYEQDVNNFAKRNLGCLLYGVGVAAIFFGGVNPMFGIGFILLLHYATVKMDRNFKADRNEIKQILDNKMKSLEEEAHRITLADVIKQDENYFRQKIAEYNSIDSE